GKMADSKIYHFDEVAKHKGAKDCWLIISGKVKLTASHLSDLLFIGKSFIFSLREEIGSVTKRIKSHGFPCCKYSNKYPVFAGKDATNDFEDIGHSNAAQEMMDKYYIGKIDTSTIPTKDTTVQKQLVIQKPDNSQEFVIKILQFLLPVIILGLAFAVRHFTKVD
ncbi:hypothetical protein BHE74_00038405, partial [Ensete ventricosum]